MKKSILLVFILSLHVSAYAQVKQSLFSFGGIVDRIYYRHAIPNRGFEFNLEDNKSTDILKTLNFNKDKNMPDESMDHNFAFLNEKKDLIDVYDKDMGVCRGYASLRRKMRLLAIFDAENRNGEMIPDRELNPEQYKKFYKNKFRNIRFYQPTIIPGFKNLKEISQDPMLGKILKWQILHEWRRKNFAKGTGTYRLIRAVFKKTKYQELLETRDRLEYFLSNKVNPIVWLTQKHSSSINSVEVVDVTKLESDGSFKVTFWNDKSLASANANSPLTIDGQGNMTYADHLEARPINGFGIVKENDGELLYIHDQLQKFCSEKPEFCPLQ